MLASTDRPRRPRRTKLVRRASYVYEATEGLVGALIADQFPHWAELPVRVLPQRGTDNINFRLGADLAVRMPRIGYAGRHIRKELRVLGHSVHPFWPIPYTDSGGFRTPP